MDKATREGAWRLGIGLAYAGAMAWMALASYYPPIRFRFDGSLKLWALSLLGVAAMLYWRKRPVRRVDWVLPVTLILLAGAAFPGTSRDWLRYLLDGEMIRLWHLSPYVHLPPEFPHDQYYQLIRGAFWVTIPSPYGPLWQALMVAVNFVSGNRMWAGIAALKLLDVAGLLVCARYLFLVTGDSRASFWLLINPVVLLNTAATPHPDIWLAVAVLAAYHLRGAAGRGAVLAAAALVKLHAAVFAPFFSRKPKDAVMTVVAMVAVAAGLLLLLKPVTGFGWVEMLVANRAGGVDAFDSLLMHSLLPGASKSLVFEASYALFAVAYAVLLAVFVMGRLAPLTALMTASWLVPLCLTGLLLPWHFIIPVVLLLALRKRVAYWAVLFLSLLVLRSAVNVVELPVLACVFAFGGWVLQRVNRELKRPPRLLTRVVAVLEF